MLNVVSTCEAPVINDFDRAPLPKLGVTQSGTVVLFTQAKPRGIVMTSPPAFDIRTGETWYAGTKGLEEYTGTLEISNK